MRDQVHSGCFAHSMLGGLWEVSGTEAAFFLRVDAALGVGSLGMLLRVIQTVMCLLM